MNIASFDGQELRRCRRRLTFPHREAPEEQQVDDATGFRIPQIDAEGRRYRLRDA